MSIIITPIQNNFQCKKQKPSSIFLVRATKIFSKAKQFLKNDLSLDLIRGNQFIRFEMHLDTEQVG
jgi:hypothetical protein